MLVLATWKREGSDSGRNWKGKKKRKERKLKRISYWKKYWGGTIEREYVRAPAWNLLWIKPRSKKYPTDEARQRFVPCISQASTTWRQPSCTTASSLHGRAHCPRQVCCPSSPSPAQPSKQTTNRQRWRLQDGKESMSLECGISGGRWVTLQRKIFTWMKSFATISKTSKKSKKILSQRRVGQRDHCIYSLRPRFVEHAAPCQRNTWTSRLFKNANEGWRKKSNAQLLQL